MRFVFTRFKFFVAREDAFEKALCARTHQRKSWITTKYSCKTCISRLTRQFFQDGYILAYNSVP